MIDSQALGDEAAHRPAQDICLGHPDCIHQPDGGVGE